MNSLSTHNQNSRLEDFGLTADRDLVRRIAIAMLAFGGALEVMYSVAFNEPDWTDAAAVGLVVIATAWVLIVRWDRSSPRLIIGPVLLGVASVALVGIGDSVSVGLSFLFLPAAVVMVFFWDDLLVKVAVMLPLTITYIAVPAIWGDQEALVEALTTLPLLLGSSMILGAMFNRFRTASVEQARFRGTITALLMALDARDDYTAEHSSEVLSLVMAVSEDLGLETKETLHTADVALLHDIGKIGIPNEILEKSSALSEDEWTVMRRHPEIGERILNEVPGFETVANAVRHEHERWDGTGYPDGLKADEIPVASRIVLACDAYHAMISERPYREPLSEAQAREQLRMNAGTQFDPGVVDALLAALEARDGNPVMQRPSWRESIEDGVANNLRVLHGEVPGGKAASL
ncbi:MAG: HD-GYP domain-containing protein [Thermoleophilaceae bacterium]|nr:HD-GYP domain-containing protein [Thermoleophilaceae bacterium]